MKLLLPLAKKTLLTVGLFAMLSFPGCITKDPEFNRLQANAVTTASGNEIVGTWYHVDDFKSLLAAWDYEGLMEVKPDGTGERITEGRFSAINTGTQNIGNKGKTFNFKWAYKGNGVWSYTQMIDPLTWLNGRMRLTKNNRLLLEYTLVCPTAPVMGWGAVKKYEVYVRTSDLKAVEEEKLRDNRSR